MESSQANQSNPNEFTVLGQGTIKDAHVAGPLDKFKKVGLFLIILILSFYSFNFLLAKFNHKAPSDEAPSKPLIKPKEAETPIALKTYADPDNLFSVQHPVNVTEGRSNDDPFPVALELRYNDPYIEIKIGEEKPGWFLRISRILDNPKNLSLLDFAKQSKIYQGEKVSTISLAGAEAITWSSILFPQTFYLVRGDDGIYFIKTHINSEFSPKHQTTIDAILGTLKFLPKKIDPNFGLVWVRRQFGDFWDLDYPQSWAVDSSGLNEGKLSLKGSYRDLNFQADFFYQILDRTVVNLNDWLIQDLSYLSADERQLLITKDLTISGTPAKAVQNLTDPNGMVIDRLYLWRRSGRNPSGLTVRQTSGEIDQTKLREIFERVVKGVR